MLRSGGLCHFLLEKQGFRACLNLNGAATARSHGGHHIGKKTGLTALRRALERGRSTAPELQDLSGKSFVEADLSGLDLTGCNFSG